MASKTSISLKMIKLRKIKTKKHCKALVIKVYKQLKSKLRKVLRGP